MILQTINTFLLTLAICSVESDFRNVYKKDDGGSPSYGICQIKHSTAEWISDREFEEDLLMDPEHNYLFAHMYVKYQLKRYKGNLKCAISAYNAGRCVKFNQKRYVDKVLYRLNNIHKFLKKDIAKKLYLKYTKKIQ